MKSSHKKLSEYSELKKKKVTWKSVQIQEKLFCLKIMLKNHKLKKRFFYFSVFS